MGGYGFGQGYFGQYNTDAIPSIPPTNIASTELAASFILVTDLAASYTTPTSLAASYGAVTELPASVEGSSS